MILTSAVLAALTFATSSAAATDAPPPPAAPRQRPPPTPADISRSPSRAPYPTTSAQGSVPGTPHAASGQAARGKRLVDTHDCHACHTPMKMGANGPEPDMSMALAGHPEKLVMPAPPKLDSMWNWVGASTNTAFAGPWGITYAINLTSDPDTGIGKWREEDFVAAIKTGKHLGVGRPIMPPMPWPAYQHLSGTELRAIFAYLKSVPPVKNRAPDYVPPK